MSILDHTPTFTAEEATQIAHSLYNLRVTAKALPSERDQNFLLQTKERRTLRAQDRQRDRRTRHARSPERGHEARSKKHLFLPACHSHQQAVKRLGSALKDGTEHFVRLVSYLPGTPLGDVKHHSNELLYDLGQKIGQLTTALEGFDHPALHRDFHWDLANGLDIVRKNGKLIQDIKLRRNRSATCFRFEQYTAPLLSDLPQSIIHNDANDYNLLAGGGDDIYTKNQSIVGLIDFGDMVHSYTVGDLAVAIAYAILGKPDPLAQPPRKSSGATTACTRSPRTNWLRSLAWSACACA